MGRRQPASFHLASSRPQLNQDTVPQPGFLRRVRCIEPFQCQPQQYGSHKDGKGMWSRTWCIQKRKHLCEQHPSALPFPREQLFRTQLGFEAVIALGVPVSLHPSRQQQGVEFLIRSYPAPTSRLFGGTVTCQPEHSFCVHHSNHILEQTRGGQVHLRSSTTPRQPWVLR